MTDPISAEQARALRCLEAPTQACARAALAILGRPWDARKSTAQPPAFCLHATGRAQAGAGAVERCSLCGARWASALAR